MRTLKKNSSPGPGRRVAGLACLGLAALTAQAFFDGGREYADLAIPQAGMVQVHPQELAVQVLYLVYGLSFAVLMAMALVWTGVATPLARLTTALARGRTLPWLLPLLVGAASLSVRVWVLQRQVITDDEETYRFIARTLLEGRLVNPPPGDPTFFQWPFLVHTTTGWFGKYPVGHPLLLALALASHAEDLLFPLLGALTAGLTYRLGRKLMGPRRALMALALLALSPHFVLTYATLLSQTTTCFLLMLGLTGLWEARRGRWGWAWLGGVALGFGVLARPMPGVLFAGIGVLLMAWPEQRARFDAGLSLRRAAAVAVPALAFGALQLAINQVQAGSPLSSGYQQLHGSFGALSAGLGGRGLSLFLAIWRENFWLFGWPVSLLAVAASRAHRGRWLLWAPVLAELVYRLAVPKTVVSTTGPTYTMEVVPVLALLGADGLARAHAGLRRLGGTRAETWVLPAAMALALGSVVFYLPVQLGALATAAEARLVVFSVLDEARVKSGLVFTQSIVALARSPTWAYFPPTPAPSADDALLFLRWPQGPDAAERTVEFWRRRFPERRAFHYLAGEKPTLLELRPPGP